MGNDGGTIARGQDLKAVYAKSGDPLRSSNQSHIDNLQHVLLLVCALTSLPLYEHGLAHAVVSDYQGKLFLKEKVLELLLSKKRSAVCPPSRRKLPHISGLGDLINLDITWSKDGHVTCPITKATKTQRSTFAYLRPCGCVFSSRLIRDIRAHHGVSELDPNPNLGDACPKCSTPFAFNYDVVMLNPEADEEIEEFNARNYKYLKERFHLGHAKKALKKEKRRKGKHVLGKVEKPKAGK